VCLFGLPASAVAQGPPTVTIGTPTVNGNYVNLSGTIASPDNCQIGLGTGCPAQYIISASPLPPTAGVTLVPLFWSNQTPLQQLALAANMRTIRSQLAVPPTTTTFTVLLRVQYGDNTVVDSSVQTFTWPGGKLSLGRVQLLRANAPEVAYRLGTGRTAFHSAVSTITIRTAAGKRLGSFRDVSEPGQNLVRVPTRLASLLIPSVSYRITLRSRDDLGRRARKTALAVL
jgi:hypothetical protein